MLAPANRLSLIPPDPLVPFDVSEADSDLVGRNGTSSAFAGRKLTDGQAGSSLAAALAGSGSAADDAAGFGVDESQLGGGDHCGELVAGARMQARGRSVHHSATEYLAATNGFSGVPSPRIGEFRFVTYRSYKYLVSFASSLASRTATASRWS